MATRFYRRGNRLGRQGYDPGPYRVVRSRPAPVVLAAQLREAYDQHAASSGRRDRAPRTAEMTQAERSRFYKRPPMTEAELEEIEMRAGIRA